MRSVINLPLEQKGNLLLLFLSRRQVWNVINYIAIALCLFFGARRFWVTPTLGTFLAFALATMCIVLLLMLSLYLFNHDLLGPLGYLVSLFDTVPPICAFLFCWMRYPRWRWTTRRLELEH